MGALTPYVPEKEIYPVCTNGMQTGTMIVKSQSHMMNKKGHLIATTLDKPVDFKCVYLGILVAIIGGVITAMVASGVVAVIAGLLIAALAGVIASCGLGGAVCRYCLDTSVWTKWHLMVKIEGNYALIGSSQIICQPLWFTPGTIQMFYSKEVADKTAEIYATNNFLRIFNGSVLGLAIGSPFVLAKALHGVVFSLLNSSLISGGLTVGGYGLGWIMAQPINNIGVEWASTQLSNAAYRYFNNIDDDGSNGLTEEPVAKNTTSNTEKAIEDALDTSTVPGLAAEDYNASMKLTGIVQGKVTMADAWKMIKADPRYSTKMSRGDLDALKSIYMSQANQTYNTAERNLATKQGLYHGSMDSFKLLGLGIGVSVLMGTILKIREKELTLLGDEEIQARIKVAIFEQDI